MARGWRSCPLSHPWHAPVNGHFRHLEAAGNSQPSCADRSPTRREPGSLPVRGVGPFPFALTPTRVAGAHHSRDLGVVFVRGEKADTTHSASSTSRRSSTRTRPSTTTCSTACSSTARSPGCPAEGRRASRCSPCSCSTHALMGARRSLDASRQRRVGRLHRRRELRGHRSPPRPPGRHDPGGRADERLPLGARHRPRRGPVLRLYGHALPADVSSAAERLEAWRSGQRASRRLRLRPQET